MYPKPLAREATEINDITSPRFVRPSMLSQFNSNNGIKTTTKSEIVSLSRNEDLSGSLNLIIFDKLCYSRDETIIKYCHWIKSIRATLDLRLSLKVPSRASGQQVGGGTFLG